MKTAAEVSADNSALMRNIRRHEHAPEGVMTDIAAPCSRWIPLFESAPYGALFDSSEFGDQCMAYGFELDNSAFCAAWTDAWGDLGSFVTVKDEVRNPSVLGARYSRDGDGSTTAIS